MATGYSATRWFSLQRRLLLLLLGGLTAGWVAAMSLSYMDAHHEIDELFDAQMVQMAQMLLALASEYDDDDDIARLETDGHRYQKRFVFQLWDEEGRLILRSQHAPTRPMADRDGFSESAGDDGRWRYFSQWDREGRLRVEVGENHHMRDELAGQVAGQLLLPGLLGLPLLGAWIWFAIRRGLAPLEEVAAQLRQRAPDRLDAVAPARAALEVRPLIEAMNNLFDRVAVALNNERRFTADAAHELRTPLAAIVAQAQVASRARDAAESAHALDQISASGRRAARLVDQLLTLARLDPGARMPMQPQRLDQLAAEVCADHGALALDKEIALELDAPVAATVVGNGDLLRTLLRNLLDNALRYTPPEGRVSVRVAATETGQTLSVADSGPGIPEQEREQALHRFRRLAGQETEGSGLGLSIVARIAELHGARLELCDASPSGGLAVSVHFSAV